MTISGMGSSSSSSALYEQWRLSLQRTSTTSTTASKATECTDEQAGGGFAAMLQDTSTPNASPAPCGLTDAHAAELGVRLQAKNAPLFKQLDSDGNGSLSAQEIIAGKDAIHTARAAQIGEQINQASPALFKALDADGDGTLSGKELDAGKALLAGIDPSASSPAAPADGTAKPHHHHHHAAPDPDQEQAAQSTLSSLMDLLDASAAADKSTDDANVRSNSLTDILQNLFSSPAASTTV